MFFVYLFSFSKKQKTIKRKSIFVFRLFRLICAKTENDKTEVDFCFPFIVFKFAQNQKMIKRKLIEVFVFLFKFAEKTKNDKTEVDFVFRLLS